MPKMKLTKRAVEAAKPQGNDVIYWDTDLKGFGLKVTPSGRRVYFVYYRNWNGQQRRPTIGDHGRIEADQARSQAKTWLGAVEKGEDPSAERAAGKKAETVAELADRYLTEYANSHKKAISAELDKALIENHITPLLGKLKVPAVKRADIERAKHDIMAGKTKRTLKAKKKRGRRIISGGPVVANRCMALLSKMFERAEAWGLRTDNPARRIEKYKERPRKRFLNAAEIGALHAALGAAEVAKTESPAALAAMRLLLLTGARRNEILMLRWREVDFENQCLRLSDSKTGEGVITLGAAALVVLASLDRREDGDFVIESAKEGSPMALTRPWQRVRKAANLGPDVKLHSLRHTFASWSVMGGFTIAQTGAVLRHKSAQTTMGYAHHEMESQRRTADAVSGAIAAVPVRPANNVVPLKAS